MIAKIQQNKTAWPWLGALVALAAVAGIVAYASMATAGGVSAQADTCADTDFASLHPMGLQHTVQSGDAAQVTLTWFGPGVSGEDTQAAACTWRTEADLSAAAADDFRSPSLQYGVQRRGPGDDTYRTLAIFQHRYHADGLSVVQRQQYIDRNAVEGETTYRVKAIWDTRGSNFASVAVAPPASGPTAGDAAPNQASLNEAAPDELVCFYMMGGDLHTISLSACTAEALAEAWDDGE